MLKCRQVSVALVLAVLTMPLAHAPTAAQTTQDVSKRVDKLEAEMRAVQRQVFPGGASKYFQPEFSPSQPGAAPAAPQGGSSELMAEMQGRITALEQQIASLTGQVEEAGFRARKAEEALTRLREDVEYRLTVLEGGDPAALSADTGADTGADAGATGATTGGRPMTGSAAAGSAAAGGAAPARPGAAQPFPPPGFDPNQPELSANATSPASAATNLSPDEQYRAAYAFVNQNDYPRAEAALRTFIERNPKHARASDAMYWLGRVHLVQRSYAQAAKAFLDTYQEFPKANRAPDSLLGLGDALAGLGNLREACQAYDQLEIDYPSAARGNLKARLSQGRAKAKCG